MDDNITIMIISLLVLIFFSAFFSATETAYSSLNRIRLKNMAELNDKAKRALKLVDNYDSLLSTILVGNNIVNIAATTIATVLFTKIYGDTGATIATIVMTVVVLIFGEVTPKSIAKESPEKFALAVSGPISFIKIILTPINFIFTLWKKLIAHFFTVENEEYMDKEELLMIVEEAQNEGDLEEHESDLISAAIEFNDLDVKEILTPRVDVVAVDIKMSMKEMEEMFRENNFSRFPVYSNSIDNIVGVIHEKDFYYLYYNKKEQGVQSIIKNVQYTSPHVKISNLLRQLQSSKMHMAVVIDEYGGTAGIITMEDILEELVGEIYDEHDEIIEYFHKEEENQWLVEAEADLDDLFEYLEMEVDEDFDCNTVGGWVIHQLEDIPDKGDHFHFRDLEVTVTKCDERMVQQVRIQRIEEQDEQEEEE